MKECDCEEFKISMKSLDQCVMWAWAHGVNYTGKEIKYCPWCGKELIERKDE